MEFYDAIADRYDELTGASGRAAAVARFVDELWRLRPIRSALDLACGTGRYAIELAGRGAAVVGADISQAMLDQAALAAGRAGVTVRWERAAMQSPESLGGPFDAVLCMGNSLPHLLSDDDLSRMLAGSRRVLATGGVLAMHLLNYHRILAQGQRVVSIDRNGPNTYVRFYDFLPQALRFNILEMHWRDGACDHRLHSTLLRPWMPQELAGAAGRAGLTGVETFGGLDMSPFEPDSSDTALLLGRRT